MRKFSIDNDQKTQRKKGEDGSAKQVGDLRLG